MFILDKPADKLVIFYDKASDKFLIRIVDKNFDDIAKYDTLPALCRVSDLYVNVLRIDNVLSETSEDNGKTSYTVNGKFLFCISANGVIETVGGCSTELGLKSLFRIPEFN